MTNGDVNEALRLKADIFSNAFEKIHGTWVSEDESKINTKLKLDINGEPLLSNFVEDKISSSETNKFKVVSTALLFGKQSSDQLSSGLFVSSKDCILNMSSVKIIDNTNINLADVLSKHDIPVVYQTLTDGSMMKTVYDNDKGCIIVIDP
nr:MAG: ADP-ribosyltransferase [Bacteriophage sp.]